MHENRRAGRGLLQEDGQERFLVRDAEPRTSCSCGRSGAHLVAEDQSDVALGELRSHDVGSPLQQQQQEQQQG